MKKVLILVMFLVICSSLCACKPYRRDVEGIENFTEMEGSIGVNSRILPSDEFLEQFPYTSAQYNYKAISQSRLSLFSADYALIVIRYDSEQYAKAKAFCLERFELVNTFEYNGYVFAENVTLAKGRDELNEDHTIAHPYLFNMFAYDDEMFCLIFVGAYHYDYIKKIEYIDENIKKDPEAWGEFWQEHFAEFYSLA